MKAVFDQRQWRHDPKHFMANGVVSPNPEQPTRIRILHQAAEAAGCTFTAPEDRGLGPIAAIHSAEYLAFLEGIYPRWQRIEGAGDEVIPNVHPDRRTASYPKSAVGQAGYHQADTACPIAAGTWAAAYWSAQTALHAAELVLDGERAVYALSRPPGHHAFGDMAGGFCFLNNAAIAAEYFRAAGLRPAIVDVDVHHGNGTQGIFYRRADVLTVSIHADPARFYPFFWGHAHERGEGAGLGANLNLPLPRGADDALFLETLHAALARVRSFGADVIIVGLGLDAHVNDPLKGFAVTTPGFERITSAIRRVGTPVLLVQEGGYISDDLGPNLTKALEGAAG
ncbi:histone deacetylase family protein [Pikeienuella sp. HZG-20]|uniref:histone deacetylase family protein n=1 Tax=Paludibacillus litoralis TaxID=3133267 RepID=UPI0030EEDE37